MNFNQQSLFIKSPTGKSLAASAVWPESGDVAGALLIVPPLVEERKALLPPLTEFSRKIASENSIASLRVDFSGTGDSEGELTEASVAEWIGEITAAAAILKEACPSAEIALLGVRTGAMLALSTTSAVAGVSSVLLWDPVTGDESVRQWLQRRMVNDMMAYGKARVSRQALLAELENGGTVDLDGFPLSGRLYSGLKSLSYPAAFAAETHVVISGRPLPSLQKWADAVRNVSLEEVKVPPYWNSVGYIDTLPLQNPSADWLAGRFGNAKGKFDFAKIPFRDDAAERIVEIPSCGHTVRGVFRNGGSSGAVLFLGGWSGDRQGPHRIFAEYAGKLSDSGVSSLRIDYLGRGESDLSHSETDIQTMAQNAADAIERLCAETGLQSADVVAICSGCKVAITLSTLSARVRDMVLWSAEAMGSLRSKDTNSKKTASAFKVYLQKLLRPETWKKILTGRVNTSMVGKALAGHETRSAAEAKNEDRTLGVFRNFKGHLTFIYGGSDPDAKLASEAYKGFCGKHGLKAEFGLIPNAGHSYYALDWTAELLEATGASLPMLNAASGKRDESVSSGK